MNEIEGTDDMTDDERGLLLTVARVLRAYIRMPVALDDDIAALSEALAPFDGIPGDPINEEEQRM